jgi:hypothetical protein
MLARSCIMTTILYSLSACGGSGGGAGGNCNEALTVGYIQNKFATEFIGFTESGTTIVHSDGNQGNTYDIDVVAVSRTAYNSDDSLAFSYTVYGTAEPPSGTYFAFYIDSDNNAATGMMVGTMGADALVVNAPGGSANGYYLWSGSNWIEQPILGSLSSNAAYFQGCTYSTTVYAPLYTGLSALYSTPATGIVMVVTIGGSDPTIITSILDTSSQFDFTIP